jgi:hypothetical protein
VQSRYRTHRSSSRLGAAVTLTPQQRAIILANLPPLPAATTAPMPSDPGFWNAASDTEKVVIVGAGVGALALVWLALKRKRRR